MKILEKYIFKFIVSHVLLVILFLIGLHMFVEFLHEFPNIGVKDYGLYKILICVILMLPNDLYQFFPIACLLGSVIALGLLASHSELIIMRVSGMSLINITSAVLKAAIFLLLIMILIGEIISPIAQRRSVQIKTAALTGGQTSLTMQGIWLRDNQDIININSASSGGLHGVTRYRFTDDKKLQFVSCAETGVYKNKSWILNNVKYTEFQDDKINNFNIPEEQVALKINPNLIGIEYIYTNQENLLDLYNYIEYRSQSGLDVAGHKVAFWQRIFAPFATLIMILLAIPFIFGLLRGSTMGLRMLVGMVFGFGFYIFHQFVGPMSVVYHVPPVLAAFLPALVFATIGTILLFKVR
ncbi:MAG: LPS export ABC transporter permease LptG [Coxiellaceae bacterium]|jgi:lipopolysaccharide export system permease protein|nr:LPS export ABC transporter permease LptG [Coxiellaceae bacterium]